MNRQVAKFAKKFVSVFPGVTATWRFNFFSDLLADG
jgi:hypothetical protein